MRQTTTLRIISGFENQTSGDVFIAGKPVNDLPANKRDTSMVFQSYAIFPHLTVGQNISFGLELKGMKKDKIRAEVDAIMKIMGLTDLINRQPSQLSEGREQPVAAVSHNPIQEGFYREGDQVAISFDPVSAHVIPKPHNQ